MKPGQPHNLEHSQSPFARRAITAVCPPERLAYALEHFLPSHQALGRAERALKADPCNDLLWGQYAAQWNRKILIDWEHRPNWFRCTLEEALADLFEPHLWVHKLRVRAGDVRSFEPLIRFLELDEWCFRSGYTKAWAMNVLKGPLLEESHRARLRAWLLKTLDLGDLRHEWMAMRKLAIGVQDEPFRAELLFRVEKGPKNRKTEAVRHPLVRRRARFFLRGCLEAVNLPTDHLDAFDIPPPHVLPKQKYVKEP